MPTLFVRRPEHVYLFHHVGKCGGTSLVKAFGTTGKQGICLGSPCHSKADVRRMARRELVSRRISPSLIRIFFGHRVYYGLHHLCPQPARYFTFLREPFSRVISLYNYHCDIATNPSHQHHERDRAILFADGNRLPFVDWFQQHYTGNHLVRFLHFAMDGELVHEPGEMGREQLESAKRFLEKCWFIGFTESSESDIPKVCQAIGIKTPTRRENVSRAHLPADEAAKARVMIEERDQLDCELFEFAKKLRGGS